VTDVAVVGLGPVGTVLAGLLGKLGVSVAGFDRAPDVFELPRAAHIDHTGLRTLQALGCLDSLLPEMIENPGVDFVTADDRLLARIPGTQSNPSNLPASMYFHQPGFDRTPRRAVGALPTVDLQVSTEVVEVRELDDGVSVRTIRDGQEADVRARYVVGCDGASSPVRESLGIGLDDLGFHEQWLVVDLRLWEPSASLPDRAVTYCDPARPLGIVPMPGNRVRFELMLLEGEVPAEMTQPAVVERLVSRWVPPGSAELERAAVYHFHGLVAERWRAGRVVLAGDAAHQMPPFLGQGMNSGLRDATNLAWKLAYLVRGEAPDALLDTYELERKPHVHAIVDASVRIGRVVCARDHDAAEAIRIEDLAFRLPRLERGPLVLEGAGQLAAQAESDDGTALFDDVVGQRFLVLARDGRVPDDSRDWWEETLGALVGTPADFPGFASGLDAILDRAGADLLVVRPDRYVLGAGDDLEPITEQVKPLLAVPATTDRS
jgi:3-(3-hydroxy-phenyl)propionate hydroxylase